MLWKGSASRPQASAQRRVLGAWGSAGPRAAMPRGRGGITAVDARRLGFPQFWSNNDNHVIIARLLREPPIAPIGERGASLLEKARDRMIGCYAPRPTETRNLTLRNAVFRWSGLRTGMRGRANK